MQDSDVPGLLSQQFAHELFGLTVVSNIELPELNSAGVSRPGCTFEMRAASAPEPIPEELIRHDYYVASGRLWRTCAKTADGFLLRFHNQADFVISRDGRRIICHPTCETAIETVRHLLLDHVIPRCLSFFGKEAIHGSAVATPHGVCGFLGGTGMGKSTLAASLVSAGCTLLGDDCLALTEVDGQVVAIPTYPGFRLWPEALAALFGDVGPLPAVCHYSPKRRLAADLASSDAPLPVRALFVLARPSSAESDEVQVERLSTGEGLARLSSYLFRLDTTDRELMARQFHFFGRLLTQALVYRLSYPRDFAILPVVRQRIFETLSCSAAASHSPPLSAD
jgi:hypothetical protein